MKYIESKQIKNILLLVLFLVVIVIVVLFGNYQKNKTSNSAKKSQLYIRFESSDIVEIQNKLPVSDSLGKKFNGEDTEEGVQGYLEFSLTNNENEKVEYDIIATKLKIEGKDISDNYVKVYLTSFDNEPLIGYDLNSVPVYRKLPYLNNSSSSKLLYSGFINGNSTEIIKLHLWLSDNYRMSTVSESFKIDVDIRVK